MPRTLSILAAAAVLAAAASSAQVPPQPQTIVEVDHVGNRVTVSGPGMAERIVDLDEAVISGPDARRLTVGDLNAGDQIMVEGALRGPRFDASAVRVVPTPDPTVVPTPDPTVVPTPDPTMRRPPGTAGEPNAFQPGEPVPSGTSRDPSALRPGEPAPPGSAPTPNAFQPGDPIPPARSGAGTR